MWPPRRDSERGQVAVEYIGMLPILILVGLGVIQFGLAAYTIQQAGTASRTAARTASYQSDGAAIQAGRSAMSDWLADDADFVFGGNAYDEVKVTVRVGIPSIIPGIPLGDTERSTTMPLD